MSKPVTFTTIAQAQQLAKRRLPASIYRSTLYGSGINQTADANKSVYEEAYFRPRAAVGTVDRDLSTSVFGVDLALPVITAPTGFNRILYSGGETSVARAATGAGTVSIISMRCSCEIEETAAAVNDPRYLWKQIYMDRSRDYVEETIKRVSDAGYGALVLTVDLPVPPSLPHAWHCGRKRPVRVDIHNAIAFGPQLITKPRWVRDFMTGGMDLERDLGPFSSPPTMPMTATWDDFEWIKKLWKGPVIAKGVVTAEDARRAVDAGSDGLVVSNHGGKGLDGVLPTLQALPSVVDAVGHQVPILIDGGIRRGTDVAKALAIGASAVLVGRSYLWGLAAGGEAGVAQVLSILRRELDNTLGLLGCQSVADLDRSFVQFPPAWTAGR